MKVFTKNMIIKKFLVVLITIIMISNFIMPNSVHAATSGEKLVSSFFYLIAKIGDVALGTMQGLMIGNKDLKDESNEYRIQYSPGMIFSNKILMLDVNFISPNQETRIGTNLSAKGEYKNRDTKEWTYNSMNNKEKNQVEDEAEEYCNKLLQDNGYIEGNGESSSQRVGQGGKKTYTWTNENDGKKYQVIYEKGQTSQNQITIRISLQVYVITEGQKELTSTANQLQKYISTWYVALRTIALVGLLSVLVYLGIKIILSSSSAQDKAKYKNMLKDWLVAICIIFMLHYIMAFLLGITQNVNEIINDQVITTSSNGTESDELMNTVRGEIGANLKETMTDPNDHVAGYTIMYLALVILTGIFTVQYLKRVIYMAFLTMIAPLIGLTYPLDKIRDGQAQAFKYWLKEYIFNCLIQPIHLLLYTVLITNSIQFAKENILYAIVALAFLVPAEKLIKEMFGMKSSSPSGTLGAAAGGAVVMSMLQKLRAKPPKEDAEGSGGKEPSGVRTATRTPALATSGTTTGTAGSTAPAGPAPAGPALTGPAPAGPAPAGPAPAGPAQAGPAPAGPAPAGPAPAGPAPAGPAPTSPAPTSSTFGTGATTYTTSPSRGVAIRAGFSAIKKRYIGDFDTWKTRGKKFVRKTGRIAGGAVLGATTATISLANEVADGHFYEDPSKAVSNIGLSAAGGYMAGSNITGRGIQTGEGVSETFKQGYYGTEQYNNMKFDKEFFKSDGYKNIEQDSTILTAFGGDKTAIKTATQEFLNNGITDSAKIREYMQHGISGNDAKDFSVLGIDKVADVEKLQTVGVNPTTYKDYSTAGAKTVAEIETLAREGINATDYGMFNTAGISKAQDIKDLQTAGIGASDIKHFASAGVKDANKILKAKRAHHGLSNEGLANRFALAKHAPKNLSAFKSMMKGREFEGATGPIGPRGLHTVTDSDAAAIYKELVDFF